MDTDNRAPKVEPEWGTVKMVTEKFGIKRGKIYQLISSGKIRSASMKEEGQPRGVRLINFDSVRAYIENCAGNESIDS